MYKRQTGFTLIELLVVVAIISLLMSVVLSSVEDARKSAQDVRRITDARSLITALETYRIKNGSFPCSSGELSTSPEFLSELVDEGYINKPLVDPQNRNEYVYYYSTFKERPGGDCGQIVQINYDVQLVDTQCILNGRKVPESDPDSRHCHIFYPYPLPCSDPYLENELAMNPDCGVLQD
jgi:general secretion pathway protein G